MKEMYKLRVIRRVVSILSDFVKGNACRYRYPITGFVDKELVERAEQFLQGMPADGTKYNDDIVAAMYEGLFNGLGKSNVKIGNFTTDEMDEELHQILREAGNKKLRIFYGDTSTGVSWVETADTVGTIGSSTGILKTLLIIPTGERGGSPISNHIVRVDEWNRGGKLSNCVRTLWKHPEFSLPAISVVDESEVTEGGRGAVVIVNGEIYSIHKEKWKAYMHASFLLGGVVPDRFLNDL